MLACSMPSADMVLVPRLPETAEGDGLYFLAYGERGGGRLQLGRAVGTRRVWLLRQQGRQAALLARGHAAPAAPKGHWRLGAENLRAFLRQARLSVCSQSR